MKRWSEKRLVRRIVTGDEEACAELVRVHHGRIFRFLVHLCRNLHTAEDLTQETFASCWMRIGSFNASSSLGTWLHRIAYNNFVDWYRRARRIDDGQKSRLLQERRHESTQGPLEEVLTDEQSRILYEAIDTLDQPNREIIVLHYLQGLSFRQMSSVLDEPVGTVKWRTNQALGQLKRLLGKSPWI